MLTATVRPTASLTMIGKKKPGRRKNWIPASGNCGKQGQGVPVGVGQPTLRRNVLLLEVPADERGNTHGLKGSALDRALGQVAAYRQS